MNTFRMELIDVLPILLHHTHALKGLHRSLRAVSKRFQQVCRAASCCCATLANADCDQVLPPITYNLQHVLPVVLAKSSWLDLPLSLRELLWKQRFAPACDSTTRMYLVALSRGCGSESVYTGSSEAPYDDGASIRSLYTRDSRHFCMHLMWLPADPMGPKCSMPCCRVLNSETHRHSTMAYRDPSNPLVDFGRRHSTVLPCDAGVMLSIVLADPFLRQLYFSTDQCLNEEALERQVIRNANSIARDPSGTAVVLLEPRGFRPALQETLTQVQADYMQVERTTIERLRVLEDAARCLRESLTADTFPAQFPDLDVVLRCTGAFARDFEEYPANTSTGQRRLLLHRAAGVLTEFLAFPVNRHEAAQRIAQQHRKRKTEKAAATRSKKAKTRADERAACENKEAANLGT